MAFSSGFRHGGAPGNLFAKDVKNPRFFAATVLFDGNACPYSEGGVFSCSAFRGGETRRFLRTRAPGHVPEDLACPGPHGLRLP